MAVSGRYNVVEIKGLLEMKITGAYPKVIHAKFEMTLDQAKLMALFIDRVQTVAGRLVFSDPDEKSGAYMVNVVLPELNRFIKEFDE